MIRPEFKFDKRWMYRDCFQKIRSQRRAELRSIEHTLKSELPSIWHVFNSVLAAAERSYDAPREDNDGLTFEYPSQIGTAYAEIELGQQCKQDVINYLSKRAKGKRAWDRHNKLWMIDRTAEEVKHKLAAAEARKYVGVFVSKPTNQDLDAMNKWLGRD